MKKIKIIFAVLFLTFSFLFVSGYTVVAGDACKNINCLGNHHCCATSDTEWNCDTPKGKSCPGGGNCRDGGNAACLNGQVCVHKPNIGVWKCENPPDPTATPVPPTATPGACACKSDNTCSASCTFDKFTDITTYKTPVVCKPADTIFKTAPTADQKNAFCKASKKTKGDSDLSGTVGIMDYFYFVSAKIGVKIPAGVNPDFNGDGNINADDRAIIVKSLTGN